MMRYSFALFLLLPTPACAQKSEPSSPQEPLAKEYSPARAAGYLDDVAVKWLKKHNCGSCHTTYAYMLARALKEHPSAAEREVRAFFEKRAANWDTAKPRWDTEVVATASALAFHDAQTTGKLHPVTRQALDRMWSLQRPDGAWNWLKLNLRPMEYDDYFGATYAAIGIGHAPDDYAQTDLAKKGLEKLRGYFRTHKAPDLHHRTMLLWAATRLDGLMSAEEREATIRDLFAVQRPDGGWNLPSLGSWKRHDNTPNSPDGPSDGYGTGLAVYVLRQAGVPASDARLQKAAAWLVAHQLESGRWFTRSLNDDNHGHYITHAGTALAVMALNACPPADQPAAAAGARDGR
jgi:squalene-hopene/tetraprenyl-beta-curcumene cyclase